MQTWLAVSTNDLFLFGMTDRSLSKIRFWPKDFCAMQDNGCTIVGPCPESCPFPSRFSDCSRGVKPASVRMLRSFMRSCAESLLEQLEHLPSLRHRQMMQSLMLSKRSPSCNMASCQTSLGITERSGTAEFVRLRSLPLAASPRWR